MTDQVTYSMRVVTRLTGLSADTIRKWEQRYGAVHPRRSQGNTRKFTKCCLKKDTKQVISHIPTQSVIDGILEPLCHPKRLEILKAVSGQSMSFSLLSKLTGLRGGNLLFHLQKLSDGGMIIQQHERGDYMITGKGFRVMEGITEMYSSLVPEEPEEN